ncbi:MAG: ATP-binding cassette domain-containing protein [Bdellovibrionales bacterium]|nr:ATP-binding cassette domain-containing protein [Bdellovibrionales bacterium]
MISLRQVSRWYAGAVSDRSRVLDQLDLELKKGEFLYVIGGTGAGKTTLLRLLATEEHPSSGSLSLFGYDLSGVSASTLQTIRRSISTISQKVQLIPDLSVFENISLAVHAAGNRSWNRDSRDRIFELLEKVQLLSKRDRPASELSGGEAQRVSVVQAIARKPELILADEPTGAQDPESAWNVLDLLMKENLTGTTVMVATHDREMVRKVRKKTAFLRNGRMQIHAEESPCRF